MPRKPARVPRYLHHKTSNRAYCRVKGKQIWLGKWQSDESLEKYRRILAEFKAENAGHIAPLTESVNGGPTVVELIAAYLNHAKSYYRDQGNVSRLKPILRLLREHYGRTPAVQFGPRKLKALVEVMITSDVDDEGTVKRIAWSRTYANMALGRIKKMFKWGASEQLFPTGVYLDLCTVEGQRKGHTKAREGRKVLPVADSAIDATLPFLPPVVADMVPLQRLTGVRPGELFIMRPCDVDRSDATCWKYTPGSHKTEHHGKNRVIFIGPKAQNILMPYLLRDSEAYCFSPAESERKRRDELHAKRKTPLNHGNRPGKNRKSKRKRPPRDQYDKDSYRRAVIRAAAKAGVEQWTPYRLRHSLATAVRNEFGLDAAQSVLGHSNAKTSEIYAQLDDRKAASVMSKIG